MKVGYWVGEFGWEIMAWVPWLRNKAQKTESMTVGCIEGHEYLYSDFASDVVTIPDTQGKNMWWCDGNKTHPLKGGIVPSREECMNDVERKYFRYGKIGATEKHIYIHARATENMRTGSRNWTVEKWGELVDGLSHDSDCCIVSIGSMDGAHHIGGTVDARGIRLQDLCDLLANGIACIGPSSGPMHLASMCGCPHVVWSDDRKQVIGCTNKERYETAWNPLNTKCRFIEGKDWNPSVSKVLNAYLAVTE
jgi:hypothetical protein